MNKKNFYTIAKEKFKFLESEYGFKLSKHKRHDWGYELIYLNNTTGVKVIYEYGEAYIFIMLYKLNNGKLPEMPIQIDNSTILYGYGLDDLILHRNPNAIIKPAYEYGEQSVYYDKEMGLSLYISAFAKNLEEYAIDILKGDFAIFPELDKIVKQRVRQYS